MWHCVLSKWYILDCFLKFCDIKSEWSSNTKNYIFPICYVLLCKHIWSYLFSWFFQYNNLCMRNLFGCLYNTISIMVYNLLMISNHLRYYFMYLYRLSKPFYVFFDTCSKMFFFLHDCNYVYHIYNNSVNRLHCYIKICRKEMLLQ